MAKTVPSFGTIHAATRIGYKWAPDLRLFVRVTQVGAFYKVEIQPPTFDARIGVQVVTVGDAVTHASRVSLWHGQEGILGYMPVLNKYMGKSTPHTFYMDDDGLELPPEIGGAADRKTAPIADLKIAEPPKEN